MKIAITTLLTLFLLTPAYAANIVDEIANEDSLSTLSESISGTALEEDLRNADGITFFAPNNDAFERLPEGFLEYLNSNEELITELVNFHIVDQALTEEDIARLSTVEPRTEGVLEVKAFEFGLFLNNAKVVNSDSADNGTVHEIDRFLVPPLLFDQEPETTVADDTSDTDDDTGTDTTDTDTTDTGDDTGTDTTDTGDDTGSDTDSDTNGDNAPEEA